MEWTKLVATVQGVIAQPGGFAVTFHWAPTHMDADKVLARLPHFLPGALLSPPVLLLQ